MKINKKQSIVRKRINSLILSIQEGIDKVCENEKFEISYVEINSALLYVLKVNNSEELKSLWEDIEEDKSINHYFK